MPVVYSIEGRLNPIDPVFKTVLDHEIHRDTTQDNFSEKRHEISAINLARVAYQKIATPPHIRHPAITASDLMSRVVQSLNPDATIQQAIALMETKGFRHIPIVSSEGGLAGIVSDRDLIRISENSTVSSVMTTKVLSATANTPIREIAAAMLDRKINAIPIVDNLGRLTGIFTTTDLLRAVVEREPFELWA